MHSGKTLAFRVASALKLFLAVTLLAVACKVVDQAGPNAAITQLTIHPDSVPVVAGQTIQFHAIGRTADGTTRPVVVQWSATGGTIDANGLYTADSVPGDFSVTATLDSSLTAKAQVKNHGALKQVELVPDSVLLAAGGTVQFTTFAIAANGDSSPVDPSYSATGGTITASGMYTAGSANGNFTVTAAVPINQKSGGTRTGTAQVIITGGTAVPVESVTVSPATASIAVGATVQLVATTKDSSGNVLTGRTITWSSSDSGTASVSSTGLVTGVAVGGPATITATSEGKSGTAAVLVTQPSSTLPHFGHVAIVVEENTNFSKVTNSSMPFLFSLMTQFALATQYYANTHPSIGNYFELTAGDTITNDDSYSLTVTADNIVRHLLAAGKTWKSYAEDLPFVGYTGPDTGNYARKHNPLSFFSDVVNDPAQVKRLVPFTQFALDLAGDTMPNYSFVVPNLCDDAHDCSLQTADNWLQANIAPLFNSPSFQTDGLLIVVFDEAGNDNTNGGGRVVWTAISPKANMGFTSTNLYQHQNTLRLMAEGLGLTSFPGAADTASNMAEFFHP